MRFGGRLFVVLVILLVMALPIGTIWMAMSCGEGKLDLFDWLFSLVVPFYGPAVALFTC